MSCRTAVLFLFLTTAQQGVLLPVGFQLGLCEHGRVGPCVGSTVFKALLYSPAEEVCDPRLAEQTALTLLEIGSLVEVFRAVCLL